MEFTARGEEVWISARDDNRVMVYDTATFTPLARYRPKARAGSSSRGARSRWVFKTWTRAVS